MLRSIPLLDQAAIDAVMQWKYTPALLNGVAVPVIMTMTVNFTLRDDTLKIGLPTGDTTTVRLAVGGGVFVDVPNIGRIMFASNGGPGAARTIAIYQVSDSGPRLLGSVEVTPNGGVVQSPGTPSFSIELVSP